MLSNAAQRICCDHPICQKLGLPDLKLEQTQNYGKRAARGYQNCPPVLQKNVLIFI